MKTTAKDILMICKEHYDHEKYGCLEDALDAYYRKYYGVYENSMLPLRYEFMCNLWLRKCVAEFATPKNIGGLWAVLFAIEFPITEEDINRDYWFQLFDRIVNWLHFLPVRDGDTWLIDLSDYEGDVI